MFRVTLTVIFAVCLCHQALAQTEEFALPADVPASLTLFPPSYAQMDGLRKDFAQPTRTLFSLDLVPSLVELKGLYTEKRQDNSLPTGAVGDPSTSPSKWGRYFDLLATSSQFDGKLVGEGGVAYSALGLSTSLEDRPMMSRMGFRGNWGKASYGLFYRSFGSGFVSTTGLKIDHARDENEVWGEYDFQLFRLRAAWLEWRERSAVNSQLTLTRTASTTFSWNRPAWNALLSSSYSLIGQGQEQQSSAFTHGFSIVYRPVNFLTVQPNVSFKEEWDAASGFRTSTPSGGLTLVGTPYPDVQLVGRASYANAFSEDPLKATSIVNTGAGLNWKLGRLFLGEESLSFQVDYQHQSNAHFVASTPAGVTGSVQLKIIGF
jgi:hypothetical protein